MQLGSLFLALFISFLWGVSPVVHKAVLQKISEHTALVVSSSIYMVCTVLYGIYHRSSIERDWRKLDTKIVGALTFTAVICGFLTNVIYFNVLKRYESHIVSALIYSSPVFTLIVAWYTLNERVRFNGFLGVVLITIGVVFLAFNKSGDEAFGLERA